MTNKAVSGRDFASLCLSPESQSAAGCRHSSAVNLRQRSAARLRYLTPLPGQDGACAHLKKTCNTPTNLDVLHFIRALTARGGGGREKPSSLRSGCNAGCRTSRRLPPCRHSSRWILINPARLHVGTSWPFHLARRGRKKCGNARKSS